MGIDIPSVFAAYNLHLNGNTDAAKEAYAKATADAALSKHALSPALSTEFEESLVARLSSLAAGIAARAKDLADAVEALGGIRGAAERAGAVRDTVLPAMAALRRVSDEAETVTAETYWPYPTYAALLFGVE